MGEKGPFGRNLWRKPQPLSHGEGKIISITGISNPRDLDGPWNDAELINSLTNGDQFFDPLWQEALIQAGTIPDYFGQGRSRDKFIKELRDFSGFLQVARQGIHGRQVPIKDSGENLEALNLGYKMGATVAADKTVQRMVADARPRAYGQKIRAFEELANKMFFHKLALSKRGITLRDVLHSDRIIESSGISQWYRFIGDCQRALVYSEINSHNGTENPVRDPFLDIAATVILLSSSDPNIFNQEGSREFKAAGREAQSITTNLQSLRSKTLQAFLDKDHPEHLGVIEAVSHTLRSQDPRIRRAAMVYLRGDTMPIEVYRAAERSLVGATGLEAETLRELMDEIDIAVHEHYPNFIVAAREFPLIMNEKLNGGFGVDMMTLQRKTSALLRVTGPFEKDFLPDNFRWGDFKKPKSTTFSVIRSKNNGDFVSFEMTFDTEEGDKTLHVILDPNRGIIDFRHVLSITDEHADFVGSFFHLLSRVIDRVRGDMQNAPGPTKGSVRDLKTNDGEVSRRVSSTVLRPVEDQRTRTERQAPKLQKIFDLGTDEYLKELTRDLPSTIASGIIVKLKEMARNGQARLKPLTHEDMFSDAGYRQFEYRMGGIDGGSLGIRIIFEQIPGEAGVLKYKPVKAIRKSEMQRPGSARSRNFRKI